MAKNNKQVNTAPVEEVKVVETPVEEVKVVETSLKVSYPEVSANGKFQYVQYGAGYVVYNPIAQRVTGIVSLTEAQDIVRNQNLAAQIK